MDLFMADWIENPPSAAAVVLLKSALPAFIVPAVEGFVVAVSGLEVGFLT